MSISRQDDNPATRRTRRKVSTLLGEIDLPAYRQQIDPVRDDALDKERDHFDSVPPALKKVFWDADNSLPEKSVEDIVGETRLAVEAAPPKKPVRRKPMSLEELYQSPDLGPMTVGRMLRRTSLIGRLKRKLGIPV